MLKTIRNPQKSTSGCHLFRVSLLFKVHRSWHCTFSTTTTTTFIYFFIDSTRPPSVKSIRAQGALTAPVTISVAHLDSSPYSCHDPSENPLLDHKKSRLTCRFDSLVGPTRHETLWPSSFQLSLPEFEGCSDQSGCPLGTHLPAAESRLKTRSSLSFHLELSTLSSPTSQR